MTKTGWVGSVLCVALTMVGCGPGAEQDAGTDGGTVATDGGVDGGTVETDAGPTDAGPLDTDAGPLDTDAGPLNTDAGPMDGGGVDAGPVTDAGPGPDAPLVSGEQSAGHDSPTWTWSSPPTAVRYAYRVDGGAFASTTDNAFTATGLTAGSYLFEVRACDAADRCSAISSFTTVVEFLGPGYPGVWSGVEKTDLATTAIGNVAAVACHNCYNGPSNEVLGVSDSLTKINLAISRGADLIELDISDAAGVMCVHHDDPGTCTGAPRLEDILADGAFGASDAMLFIEIKERGLAPAAFATALLDRLDSNRDFVRNGRPAFIRAFSGSAAYVLAVRDAAANYPIIAPYLRYSLLYGEDAAAVADLQMQAQTAAGEGIDMIELHYQQENFAGIAGYARSIGLAVGTWTVPGSFGEVFVASLREEVDQITAEYRADRARAVLEETNTIAYVNSGPCTSAGVTTLPILRNTGAGLVMDAFPIDVAPTANLHGTPPLHFDSIGEDRFGCSLDYRAATGSDRAVDLDVAPTGAEEGFLVTAVVNFDGLSIDGTRAILNSSQSGGFALELVGNGTTTRLRFGVHVGGAYRYHEYDVASTGLASGDTLNGTNSYFLVGAYDGAGGVYLFIDNERVGSGGNHTGGVTPVTVPALIGADPQTGGIRARSFFTGFVQQAMVLQWGDHSTTGSLVN